MKRMSRCFAALLCVLFGCTQRNPSYCDSNDDCADGTHCEVAAHTCVLNGVVDASSDASGACIAIGAGIFAVCVDAAVLHDVDLTSATTEFFTHSDPSCLPTVPEQWLNNGQPPACFVVGKNIRVPTLAVEGTRPLVLLATDTITIAGLLDVASHSPPPGKTGPGANDTACNPGSGPGNDPLAAGGGAGATFVTAGGNGGKGNNAMSVGGTAAMPSTTAPRHLRGGCRGQYGGAGGGGVNGGISGEGGGAVYVGAANVIDVRTGAINASGGGGYSGNARGGGGGGGSGGMIVLFAPSIMTSSATRIVANGGGGGAGWNSTHAGEDPNVQNATTPAIGGQATAACANQNGGGFGAALNSAATPGGSVTTEVCAGGGGGGGAGFIQTSVALGSGVFSPAPVIQ